MSLNTNTVNSTGSIQAEAIFVDAIQQDHLFQLPLEIIPIILRNLPVTKLSTWSLVCKHWKAIVDKDDFLIKMILPQNFNGPQRWTEYTKGAVGDAPALPRWVFRCMQKGEHMLAYIPETVKITNQEGTEMELPINNLEVVGNLFANTINGRNIEFSQYSWTDAIKEKRLLEKGHWVLLSKRAEGRNLFYEEQVAKAKEMDANVSDLIDTVISLFMEFLRTGELHFIWYPSEDGGTWIRVNDQTREVRLGLGFHHSALRVSSSSFFCPSRQWNRFCPCAQVFWDYMILTCYGQGHETHS